LSATTALAGIYEVKSQTAPDSLHCYTDAENRRIALLLYRGETCDTLLNVAEREIALLKTINGQCDSINRNLLRMRVDADSLMSRFSVENAKLLDANEKLAKRNKVKNRIIGGSLGLNLLLIILIVL
jgi:hypothetical protein